MKQRFIGDLHIHSRFSRACSKGLNLDNLVKWAKIKGIDFLGTGDISHPEWFEEIKEKLKDNGKGFFIHKETKFPFILTGEISLIYSQDGKGRKVHLVLLVPSLEVAEMIHDYLDSKGRRDYDGRPIFGIPCDEFVRAMKEISEEIEIIPAHIWTPYFGVFGSMSGFNSLKQAFKEQAESINAIETGISSDPEMNWRIKELTDKDISIVSFSDSHSFWPWRLGREATIFKKTDSYKELIRQIRENDFIGTIETDPAYGKYHWDGHAGCGFSCSPEKTIELGGVCPKCGKRLTIGVENRVDVISKNPLDYKPESGKMFYKILPLHEIISLYLSKGINTKSVWKVYDDFIEKFENEFNILLDASKEEMIEKGFEEELVNLIIKNREGNIKVQPGYDGEYGKALIEDVKSEGQKRLF